jgi:flagellar hook-associated protein 1 FlgK
LDIARAGLLVAQTQLDVAGHNIANVNKPGFSRQRVDITTRVPNFTPFGALGRGPALAGVSRLRERFLDTTYRRQVPGFGDARIQAQFYSRIEDIFQEPAARGFGTRLTQFFDALNDFANAVEDVPTRVAVLEEARAVSASLNEVDQRLQILRTSANENVRDQVERINSLTDRIAKMNQVIRDAELSGRAANDLRDDRDVLIDELSEIIDLNVRERDDGQFDIQFSGVFIVSGTKTAALRAVPDASIDPARPDLLQVEFVATGQAAVVQGGELAGALRIRDVELRDLQARFDTLAQNLIQSINDIHNQGSGLNDIGGPLESTNSVTDADASLATGAGLPFAVQDGSFQILLYDANGVAQAPITINLVASGPVPAQTTLNDLALDITVNPNITATVANGRIEITPAAGFTFRFANDSSGALTALGLNGFFQGSDAGSIAVSSHLAENPSLISSGFSTDPAETGDNTAALAMAGLRDLATLEGDTQSILQYYESTVVRVGVNARANEDLLVVEEAFKLDLERRKQEVSGVNLDEEVTSLILFQRAFEASARVITVADRMLDALVNLGR